MHRGIHGEGAGMCCALASAVLFGTMPFLAQVACSYGGNAVTVACGRFAFGCALCLPFLRVARAPVKLQLRQMRHVLGLSLLYAVTLVLLFSSYGSIGTGVATALHFTYPVAVLALAGILFHVRLTVSHMLCVALCVAGVLLLAVPESQGGLAGYGAAMAAASGLTYAFYIVLLAHSELRSVPAFTITFWLSFFAALEIGAYAAVTGSFTLGMAWQGWAAVGCLGLFSTVFALALFQKGVFLCGEIKTSLCSNVEPLTGVLIGLLAFHEPVSVGVGAGVACILTSTVVSAVSPRSRGCGAAGS